MRRFGFVTLGVAVLLAGTAGRAAAQGPTHLRTETADGVTLHGELFAEGMDAASPLVLLFHQAGSSGRGEYAGIAAWLSSLGFRAVAWDQRSGGDLHGSPNRTVEGLPEGAPSGFCDAYADLQAALEHVVASGLSPRPIVWGSSYSAALVFRLAAENPERVSALLAFSPASGGPMAECRARSWLGDLTVPAAVFRPRSEMGRESSLQQRDLFDEAGVDFFVIEHGVHGSSMLVDDRTGHDMTAARAVVADWLSEGQVRRTLESYYDAFSARDWTRFEGHFWDGATMTTVWMPEGERVERVVATSIPDFVAQAPEGPGSREIFEERMVSADIVVEGDLAQARVRYRARFGDPGDVMEWEGSDVFTLIRFGGEWRITSLAYLSDPG